MASALALQSPVGAIAEGIRPRTVGQAGDEGFLPWAHRLQIVTRDDEHDRAEGEPGAERLIQGRDLVEFIFQVSGSSLLVREGCPDTIVQPNMGLVGFHRQDRLARWYDEGTSQRRVSILCDTQLLLRLMPEDGMSQSRLIDYFAARETIGMRYNPAIWRVAERLLGYEGDRHWRDLLVQANAIELLCAGIRSILEHAARGETYRTGLSDRDIEALNAARRYIVGHLAEAPTIQQIARTVGLNQQKLKVGFRAVFGETIYAFTLTRRMEVAWHLLDQERQPIKVVAARVGYRCPNSFARAFERHWNVLPGSVRRGVTQAAMAC